MDCVCVVHCNIVHTSGGHRSSRLLPDRVRQPLHLGGKLARPAVNRVIHRQHQLRVNRLILLHSGSSSYDNCFLHPLLLLLLKPIIVAVLLMGIVSTLHFRPIEALLCGFLSRGLLGPALQVEIGSAWHDKRRRSSRSENQ